VLSGPTGSRSLGQSNPKTRRKSTPPGEGVSGRHPATPGALMDNRRGSSGGDADNSPARTIGLREGI
jgi:hypothetical protein